MICSRCITCSLEYPQNAPAFCRCGGSTFTTIVSDDDAEAPTTSPEGRGPSIPLGPDGTHYATGPTAAAGDHYTLGPTAADSTGPTPPPSVSESSSGSASAPQPGAADEPDDDSEADDERHLHRLHALPGDDVGGFKCLQDGCGKPATHQFFWPSADEPSTRYACAEHAKKAEQLAPALGFSADVKPLAERCTFESDGERCKRVRHDDDRHDFMNWEPPLR